MSLVSVAPGWSINVCIGTKRASGALLWSPPEVPGGGRGCGRPAAASPSGLSAWPGTGWAGRFSWCSPSGRGRTGTAAVCGKTARSEKSALFVPFPQPSLPACIYFCKVRNVIKTTGRLLK